MIPKEKAKKIVDKYIQINGNGFFAKECAVFTVEEIISAIKITTDHCELRKLDWHEVQKDFKYWQEVKTEIEKL